MFTVFVILNGLFGMTGGFISGVFLKRKYSWKVNCEEFAVRMALCMIGGAGAGIGLVKIAEHCGIFAELISTIAIAPIIVGGVVLPLKMAPAVKRYREQLLDYLVSLTVKQTCKNDSLQQRIEELETLVRNLHGPSISGDHDAENHCKGHGADKQSEQNGAG